MKKCYACETKKLRTARYHMKIMCTAISVNDFWANKQLLWSSASLFIWPASLWIFFHPRSRNYLKKRHFGTLKNILTAITNQLKTIPVSKDTLAAQGELILKEALFNCNKIVLKIHFYYLNYASFICRMYKRIQNLIKQFFNTEYG